MKPETKAKPLQSKKRSSLASLAAGVASVAHPGSRAAHRGYSMQTGPPSVATRSPAEAAPLSIVVLPFANLSGDPAQDYLADALTDELITGVTRVQRQLRDRPQYRLHLQRQASRRQGDR